MTIHIVGAGLAGLSAALALSSARGGAGIVVHEAAPQAGGRCRSWEDRHLGLEIDNGTHAVLGANDAVRRHLALLGTEGEMHWLPDGPAMRWPARDAAWPIGGPSDLLQAWRRIGGGAAAEVATLLRLVLPLGAPTIGGRFAAGSSLAEGLWDPIARAVMNTPAAEADANAFARVMRMTLARGRAAMRMGVARRSLGRCFIEPALARLRQCGVELRFGDRLRAMSSDPRGTTRVVFAAGAVDLGPGDHLLLAIPPWELESLRPDLAPAWRASPIVNLHVRLPETRDIGPAGPRMTGLVGTAAEWILDRGPIASVTASAADELAQEPPHRAAQRLWRDAAPVLGLGGADLPTTWRLVKERRATPLQTPDFVRERARLPRADDRAILAGDWTIPDLPCTIETALRSGVAAAERILGLARER